MEWQCHEKLHSAIITLKDGTNVECERSGTEVTVRSVWGETTEERVTEGRKVFAMLEDKLDAWSMIPEASR